MIDLFMPVSMTVLGAVLIAYGALSLVGWTKLLPVRLQPYPEAKSRMRKLSIWYLLGGVILIWAVWTVRSMEPGKAWLLSLCALLLILAVIAFVSDLTAGKLEQQGIPGKTRGGRLCYRVMLGILLIRTLLKPFDSAFLNGLCMVAVFLCLILMNARNYFAPADTEKTVKDGSE